MADTKTVDLVADLVAAVWLMHKVDDAHGCGFYNNREWRKQYHATRELASKLEAMTRKPKGDEDGTV